MGLKQCKIYFDTQLYFVCTVINPSPNVYTLTCPDPATVYFVQSQKESFYTGLLSVYDLRISRESDNIVLFSEYPYATSIIVESDNIYIFKNKDNEIAVTLSKPRDVTLVTIEEAVR